MQLDHSGTNLHPGHSNTLNPENWQRCVVLKRENGENTLRFFVRNNTIRGI